MHFTAIDTREELAARLAGHVADKLRAAIEITGWASIAVSGGSTPKLFFSELSRRELDWEKVWVTLVDERWVAPSDSRSNQRMVAIELLEGAAAHAHFLPLYREDIEAAEIATIEDELRPLLPLDVVVLGMGEDGHTASLFPGGSRLAEAVSEDATALLIDMRAPAAGEPRVTLTLPVITAAKNLYLHIEGEKKREALDRALDIADPAQAPIRYVLDARQDIRVVWSP